VELLCACVESQGQFFFTYYEIEHYVDFMQLLYLVNTELIEVTILLDVENLQQY